MLRREGLHQGGQGQGGVCEEVARGRQHVERQAQRGRGAVAGVAHHQRHVRLRGGVVLALLPRVELLQEGD